MMADRRRGPGVHTHGIREGSVQSVQVRTERHQYDVDRLLVRYSQDGTGESPNQDIGEDDLQHAVLENLPLGGRSTDHSR